MRITASRIQEILPAALKRSCLIGICDPRYLQKKQRVFCKIPAVYGGPRWSAKPREVLPEAKSIIALLHFTPLGFDYAVDKHVLSIAGIIWKKLGVRTHLLDASGRPDARNVIGHERSRFGNYDARKRMILLKEIAYYAGLGQFGKNSLLINRSFGSDMKIQALFTGSSLEPGKPLIPKAHPACAECDICVDNCPSGIIRGYLVSAGDKDLCKGRAGKKPVLIGRLIKKRDLWDKAFLDQKLSCRICQSFCPLNKRHYFKDSLVFVKKSGGPGKYTFYYRTKNR